MQREDKGGIKTNRTSYSSGNVGNLCPYLQSYTSAYGRNHSVHLRIPELSPVQGISKCVQNDQVSE